jgi:hypothetical protein
MCRWTVIALAICLCLFAVHFSAALQPALSSDMAARDSASVASADTAHATAVGAFTAFGFRIYRAMAEACRWVSAQLQPVFRAVSRFFKEVFGEHYDENSILRVPLSRRS